MGEFELKRFADSASLVSEAAGDWLDLFRARSKEHPFCVALPGGRITPLLFSTFADRVKAEGADLRSVHFFWGDERCVPPTSPESNFRSAWEHLLDPLQIPEGQIHRIRGELAPGAAAVQAEADLRAVCGAQELKTPSLQLVVLGMGEDGHLASLFPAEADSWMSNPAVYRPVTASKPPPLRVTLGYSAIAAAQRVWVLISGAGKGEMLRRSLSRRDTPLGRVLNLRPNTRLYTDQALGK